MGLIDLGGSSCSPSRIPTPLTTKASAPTTTVPIPKLSTENLGCSNASFHSNPVEDSQMLPVSKNQAQVRTRPSRSSISNSPNNVDNPTNNQMKPIQRPQSIDIEDEFNDKIRYARLTALQENANGGVCQANYTTDGAKQQPLENEIKAKFTTKMAPLFSPSRKVLLESNTKQVIAPISQKTSPSRIPIANDYLDASTSKNHKRSNASPPRKVTPPSQVTSPLQDMQVVSSGRKLSASSCSSSSRYGSNDDLLSKVDNTSTMIPNDKTVSRNNRKFSNLYSNENELQETSSNGISGDGCNIPGSPPNGTNTDRNQSTKFVPCTSETIVSKIPLPKIINSRSRSGSTSPSKQHTGSRESSPAINQSPTRGRPETKTPVGQQIHVISSKGSPTSPGLPTLGWSLQKEKQKLRPKENTPHDLPDTTLYQGKLQKMCTGRSSVF